jgi:hypothetical protein
MDRKDFVLMVVAAGEDTPLTPVQLQKSLFLIEKNLPSVPDHFYEFEPYHYGPFDADVYSDADTLEGEGLLLSMRSSKGTWTDRMITPSGLRRAEEVEEGLPENVRKYIHDVVKWAQSLTFTDLVRSIYTQYPNYKQNSVFRG